MLWLLLRSDIKPVDVIFGLVMLISAAIVFVAIWKLYATYGKKLWLVPAAGIGLFIIGAFFDLLDEFTRLPEMVGNFEDGSSAIGITVFSLGLLITVRQLIRMSIVDSLTGLHNKRYLEELLKKEFEISRRSELPITIIFMDVDRFKSINDSMGHLLGDSVLQSIALILREETRSIDWPARFGGDEFVIVMPNTKLSNAQMVIARIKSIINALELPNGERVAISFGVAQFPGDGDTPNQLLTYASKLMYENRRSKL